MAYSLPVSKPCLIIGSCNKFQMFTHSGYDRCAWRHRNRFAISMPRRGSINGKKSIFRLTESKILIFINDRIGRSFIHLVWILSGPELGKHRAILRSRIVVKLLLEISIGIFIRDFKIRVHAAPAGAALRVSGIGWRVLTQHSAGAG